jgi:hypothetical protein
MLLKYYSSFDINIFYMNIILDIILEGFFLGIAFYIFYRLYIKKEIKNIEKERGNILNLITWGILFLLMGIAHILKILISFASISESGSVDLENFLGKSGIILIFIAFLIKIIYLERVINKQEIYKGYYFSIIFSIVIIAIAIIDLEALLAIGALQYIVLGLMALGYSILPFLYLYLAIKTVGETRKNALKVSIGILLFGLFSLFQADALEGYIGDSFFDVIIEITYITGPIGVIISTVLILDSFRKK